MNQKNTIVQNSYELLKEVIPVVNKFSRNHKFTLGDRLQNHLSDLMELYIQAYYISAQEKRALLNQANIQLEILRHYFRLAYDLGLYNSTRYEYFARKLNAIGTKTGAWIKSLK